MRLIDADALVKCVNKIFGLKPDARWSHGAVLNTIDAAPTIGGWVSVEDRLPDKQPCECLVVNANNVETAICLDNRWITPRRVIKITHWMPLPEPPKEESDD